MKKYIIIGTLALIVLAGSIYSYVIYDQSIQAQKRFQETSRLANESFDKHQKAFWEDHDEFKKHEFFYSRNTKNARDFFSKAFTINEKGTEFSSFLDLPEELIKELDESKKKWTTLSPMKAQGLDFSWFSQISAFDHWEILSPELIKEHIQKEDAYLAPPIFNYKHFTHWTKLYLIHARSQKSLIKASLHIRKLVQLLISQENLIASLMAVKLLEHENHAYKEWTKSGFIISDWATFSYRDTRRMIRMIMASSGFLSPLLTPQNMTSIDKLEILKCTPLNESLIYFSLPKEIFLEVTPVFYNKTISLLETSSCRVKYLRAYLQVKDKEELPPFKEQLVKNKFFARTMGSLILNTAAPNFFSAYSKPLPEAQ